MCINYIPTSAQTLVDCFSVLPPPEAIWPGEAYQDYLAPIIRADERGNRESVLAAYSMVPKRHIEAGVKRFSTMNARAESIGQLRSYAPSWHASRLCLVPMRAFFEPNWETGAHVRWRIGLADDEDFAVAGIWREWSEQDGSTSHAFTQITVNADQHPLMQRFHRPDDEKRSLVIVPPDEYDAWLGCKNPELARSFLRLYPPELMAAAPAPKESRQPKVSQDIKQQHAQSSLFELE